MCLCAPNRSRCFAGGTEVNPLLICLSCYKALGANERDFHPRCARRLFGTDSPPALDFNFDQIAEELSAISIRGTMPGVQPKLSLDVTANHRMTLVGLWGKYIMKPPSAEYPMAPEIEDLTMHLARVVKLRTADHTLYRLPNGRLAYITKRFDRTGGARPKKLAMEDMCQLTGKLTEQKYRSSMERIATAIRQFSTQPDLDLATFFTLSLFAFATGNADMHLKNISLFSPRAGIITMTPAYDLLSTTLLIPGDGEEMALPLSGKKANLRRKDFDTFAALIKLNPQYQQAAYNQLGRALPSMRALINTSFLSEAQKANYLTLIEQRAHRLELI